MLSLVGGRDDLLVADRAARRHDRGDAGVGQDVQPVAEREEGVGGRAAVDDRQDGLGHGEPAGVDAAHLARADADRLAGVGEDDGVGLDAPRDLPGELARRPLDGGGLALGGDPPARRSGRARSRRPGRGDRPRSASSRARRSGARDTGSFGEPDVRLLREEVDRLLREVVRRDDLDEVLEDEGGQRPVDAPADGDDAAEGGQRDRRRRRGRTPPRSSRRWPRRRVVVLDDDGRRAVEVARERDGRVEVEQVVEGELLALEHLETHEGVGRRLRGRDRARRADAGSPRTAGSWPGRTRGPGSPGTPRRSGRATRSTGRSQRRRRRCGRRRGPPAAPAWRGSSRRSCGSPRGPARSPPGPRRRSPARGSWPRPGSGRARRRRSSRGSLGGTCRAATVFSKG